jgi:predicted acetyltransferase
VDYQFHTSTAADWDEIAQVMFEAFNDDVDEKAAEVERGVFEPERSVVAKLDGAIAGHAATFTRDLAVPGGTVPAAHVTMVSVGATHRRQGLLTTMLGRLHADAAERNEPIAVLWASEGKIYQRYGYGLAAQKLAFECRSSELTWLTPSAPDPGRRRAVRSSAIEEFRDVYEAVWRDRPGYSTRDDRWWTYVTSDVPSQRQGRSALRAVVHEDASGRADGYLLWRVKGDWNDGGPVGTVLVRELVAANPTAYRSLWEFALSVDLTRNVRFGFAASDEPLQFMVTEPRRLEAKLTDALWVRVLDVPRALEARRYAAPVDVVLDVTDARIPANNGRWHLLADRDKSVCTATDAPTDLALDVAALGAAYLGGTSLRTLAACDRVSELRSPALAIASTAFGWPRDPSATEVF